MMKPGILTGFLSIVALSLSLTATAFAEWVPFSIENGHIIIDVRIDDQPAKAMLDSGAMSNMISSRFAEKHGQSFHTAGKARTQGVNSVQRTQVYNNVPVSVFGSELLLDNVVSGSFRIADLIFGSGFFRSGILQLDYPNSRLRFLAKGSVDLKKHANVSMRKASDSFLPAVEVLLRGKKTWLLFDTGNSGGLVLRRSYALDNELIDTATGGDQFIAAGVNSIATFERYRMDSVAIGPFELENVETAVPAEGHAANLGSRHYVDTRSRLQRGVKTEGLLGYDVLKHFVVTVDYKKYRLHLHAP